MAHMGSMLVWVLSLQDKKASPRILGGVYWVAVKELSLSYYIGETLLFTIYIYTYIYPLW